MIKTMFVSSDEQEEFSEDLEWKLDTLQKDGYEIVDIKYQAAPYIWAKETWITYTAIIVYREVIQSRNEVRG